VSDISIGVHADNKKSILKNYGIEVIKSYLQDLTTSAGVYRMLDSEGQVLYVGKAKKFKK